MNPFLLRSLLFCPAIKQRFMEKMLTLHHVNKPDAIIFDLEDSIENTKEAKENARTQLLRWLSNTRYREKLFSRFIVGIRINNSEETKQDLEIVNQLSPHFVVIPKVATKEDVCFYQSIFPKTPLCISIETLDGYENRESITKALRISDFLAIGYEDLSAELGIERPDLFVEPTPLTHIINSCIISAKKYNVVLLDGPSRKYGSKENIDKLKKECLLSLNMGFQSKVAIHPTQIKVINNAFSKEKLRKHAEKILQQFHALDDGTFVIASEEQEMMDMPSFQLYSKTLKLLQK